MRNLLRFAATLLAAGLAVSAGSMPADAAPVVHALIQGSGSSWAANAVNQWIIDTHANGLQVVFTSNGSAQGRKDFANNTVDFAVSDIGYQGTDPATGQADTSQGRQFAYLPIVAGGTALTYQINVGGHLVTNLRLSGETVTKIFTQQITNWDDPEITKDNNGHALPSLPIIPVVHSEGSGSSYQFTRYMATEYPSIWKPFSDGLGATEYFPSVGGSMVAQNGSDGVMNFVTSGAANGAIGYDEYSYALGKGYPVVDLLNKAGYFVKPNQYNVAVALTKAKINTNKSSPDYLLQNLDNVYGYGDPRTYPMSSYSYAIIPTGSTDKQETTAKRQTIADYLDYSVCQGQGEMGQIGYSPLPINLVQASFDQIKKLKTADSGVDISNVKVTKCDNPTFIAGHPTENYLAKVAPQPPSCAKIGNGPCTTSTDPGLNNPGSGNGAPPANPNNHNPGGNNNSGNTPGNNNSGNTPGKHHRGKHGNTGNNPANPNPNPGTSTQPGTVNGITTSAPPGNTGTDPVTGQPIGGTTSIDPVTGQQVGTTNGTTGDTTAVAQPVSLPDSQSGNSKVVLGVLAGVLLLGLLVAPPLVSSALSKRKGPQ